MIHTATDLIIQLTCEDSCKSLQWHQFQRSVVVDFVQWHHTLDNIWECLHYDDTNCKSICVKKNKRKISVAFNLPLQPPLTSQIFLVPFSFVIPIGCRFNLCNVIFI